jgi:hypothetical protein
MALHALLIAAAFTQPNPNLGSGLGALVAVGGRATVSDHLTLGFRGSARSSSMQQSCEAAFGPAAFDVPLLFALSSTFEFRW